MTTYIIDWGKDTRRGRYAIAQARDLENLSWVLDDIGELGAGATYSKLDLFHKALSMEMGDLLGYMELSSKEDCYTNSMEDLIPLMKFQPLLDTLYPPTQTSYP